MSWWLFLPLAYLAMGFDQIFASEFTWRGVAPGGLLLLWSALVVRSGSSRSLSQACLLGMLTDLNTGSTLGVTSAVFVSVSFLLWRRRTGEAAEPLRWLWWSFPLMLVSLGASVACEWLLQSSAVSLRLLARQTLLTVAVTFGWGFSVMLLAWATRQLFRFPHDSVPRELEASSFFLSR